jgi:hypothetical protein
LPLEMADKCLEVIKLAQRVLVIGNKNVLSDAKVAIACAHAAFYSSLYNVDINLHSIKDEDFKAKAAAKEQAMKAEMEELQPQILIRKLQSYYILCSTIFLRQFKIIDKLTVIMYNLCIERIFTNKMQRFTFIWGFCLGRWSPLF